MKNPASNLRSCLVLTTLLSGTCALAALNPPTTAPTAPPATAPAAANWKELLAANPTMDQVALALSKHPALLSDYVPEAGQAPVTNRVFVSLVDWLKRETADHLVENSSRPADAWAQNLLALHTYFRGQSDYASLLLADTTKRMLLRWAQKAVLESKTPAERAAIVQLLEPTTMRGMDLRSIYGPAKLPDVNPAPARGSDEEIGRIVASCGETKLEKLPGLGFFTGTRPGFNEAAGAAGYPSVLLARVILSEAILRLGMPGTIRFLDLGGTVESLDAGGSAAFDKVMSLQECRRFTFPLIARKALAPTDVHLFCNRWSRGPTTATKMSTPIPVFE